jgi:opacity protein-like surface antigen
MAAKRFLAASFVLVSLCAANARADEPLFGYVYTSDLLPKGKWEIEQWITAQYKQSQGRYLGLPMRTEIEHGITDNFQVSGYLNYSHVSANNNAVGGGTSGLHIPEDHDPSQPYSNTHFDSVSAEFIYRILSPYKDPIGLAVYVEPGWGPREHELETRVIFQKNFLDDRLVLAANVWSEWEHEFKTGNPSAPPGADDANARWEKDSMFEYDLGASWRFTSNWAVGLEYRNHNEFSGWDLSKADQEHQASFFGPNIHYGGKDWFFTFTVLKQLRTAHPYSDDNKANTVDSRVYGDEHTLYDGIRLKVGFFF